MWLVFKCSHNPRKPAGNTKVSTPLLRKREKISDRCQDPLVDLEQAKIEVDTHMYVRPVHVYLYILYCNPSETGQTSPVVTL